MTGRPRPRDRCFLFLMSNQPGCVDRVPNLVCDTGIPITVIPGTCVEITNPCATNGE